MRHAEYKVPGGKLVVVDLQCDASTISHIQLSGDFFLEPAEALDAINHALTGLAVQASEAEIAATVRAALPANAELFGFDPEAVAVVIKRALA